MAPAISKREEEEDRIIAVLITETFNDNFEPLIKYDPLALTPLVNSPILDYSLDWLQRCEVFETIVYCCAQPHSEKIRDHCRQWSLKFGNVMKINVISSENASSLGDAMRDLYTKSLLKNDFILLNGAVVGNLDLKAVLGKYRNAHKRDASCVMSCVYLQNRELNRDLDSSRLINLIVDAKTGKILSHARSGRFSKLNMPTDIISSASKLKVLSRIEDPSIAICSQMIPALFSDNFDYGTRDNLVQGLIEQEELLGCTIHSQVVDGCYGAVISSFKSFEEISNAVIKRKAFPSVPERSLSSQRIRYLFQPFSGSYWDVSAKFHKKSIGENVVIDAGTEIDPRCRIRNSVIGKHCVIKENINVNDSYLLSNVMVNKGSILDNCFIGNDVRLLPGVHLEPGVVLGSKIILGPNLKVNRCVKLMDESYGRNDSSDESELNPLICGKEGRAFICREEIHGPEEMILPNSQWGAEPRGEEGSDESSDEGSEESDDEGKFKGRGADADDAMSSDEEREQEFEREVKDSVINAYKQKSAMDNVILEINSSRHAYNITMENVLATVTKIILHVVEESCDECFTGEKLWQSVKQGFQCFGDLIKNYIRKVKDQMVVLKALEDVVDEENRYLPALQHILYELSQELDILDDEVILYWYSKGEDHTEAFPSIEKSISKFINWLQENEKEEEETDSDDD